MRRGKPESNIYQTTFAVQHLFSRPKPNPKPHKRVIAPGADLGPVHNLSVDSKPLIGNDFSGHSGAGFLPPDHHIWFIGRAQSISPHNLLGVGTHRKFGHFFPHLHIFTSPFPPPRVGSDLNSSLTNETERPHQQQLARSGVIAAARIRRNQNPTILRPGIPPRQPGFPHSGPTSPGTMRCFAQCAQDRAHSCIQSALRCVWNYDACGVIQNTTTHPVRDPRPRVTPQGTHHSTTPPHDDQHNEVPSR